MHVNVVPSLGESPQLCSLLPVEIDEVVFPERRLDLEGDQRASRDLRTGLPRDVRTGAREGINVDMLQRDGLLSREDLGVGRSVLLDDLELNLRPLSDAIELQRRAIRSPKSLPGLFIRGSDARHTDK